MERQRLGSHLYSSACVPPHSAWTNLQEQRRCSCVGVRRVCLFYPWLPVRASRINMTSSQKICARAANQPTAACKQQPASEPANQPACSMQHAAHACMKHAAPAIMQHTALDSHSACSMQPASQPANEPACSMHMHVNF